MLHMDDFRDEDFEGVSQETTFLNPLDKACFEIREACVFVDRSTRSTLAGVIRKYKAMYFSTTRNAANHAHSTLIRNKPPNISLPSRMPTIHSQIASSHE